jgi:hypothetical protein
MFRFVDDCVRQRFREPEKADILGKPPFFKDTAAPMIRLALFAALSTALAAPAHAACQPGGLLDTCVDAPDRQAPSEEEEYQRLDGGGFGGRPAATTRGKVITVGDTTVTLGQTDEVENQPWQPFNREFGDYDSLSREDRPKDPGDPLKTQCHADGCY